MDSPIRKCRKTQFWNPFLTPKHTDGGPSVYLFLACPLTLSFIHFSSLLIHEGLLNYKRATEEVAQWVKACLSKPEDRSSIPGPHVKNVCTLSTPTVRWEMSLKNQPEVPGVSFHGACCVVAEGTRETLPQNKMEDSYLLTSIGTTIHEGTHTHTHKGRFTALVVGIGSG